jgi:hypothetical protein
LAQVAASLRFQRRGRKKEKEERVEKEKKEGIECDESGLRSGGGTRVSLLTRERSEEEGKGKHTNQPPMIWNGKSISTATAMSSFRKPFSSSLSEVTESFAMKPIFEMR